MALSYTERLNKLNNKNLTNNKTYPPFIIREIIIEHKPINYVEYDSVKKDIVCLNLTHTIKTKLEFYQNTKTHRYYIYDPYGRNCYFKTNYLCFKTKYLFDITDAYDWEKMLKENVFSKDYATKHVQHVETKTETKKYYAGSPEYDSLYPPII